MVRDGTAGGVREMTGHRGPPTPWTPRRRGEDGVGGLCAAKGRWLVEDTRRDKDLGSLNPALSVSSRQTSTTPTHGYTT